jgi:hypothetical protein
VAEEEKREMDKSDPQEHLMMSQKRKKKNDKFDASE